MPGLSDSAHGGLSKGGSVRRHTSALRKSEDLAARVGDLWHFYDEHGAQARQHENLRATVSGTLAAIAAAVTALAGVGGLTAADVPAGLVIIIIGGWRRPQLEAFRAESFPC